MPATSVDIRKQQLRRRVAAVATQQPLTQALADAGLIVRFSWPMFICSWLTTSMSRLLFVALAGVVSGALLTAQRTVALLIQGRMDGGDNVGPLQLLGWNSGFAIAPPMQYIHPAFAVLKHQTKHGTPTVR